MAQAQVVYPTNTPPPTREEAVAAANNRSLKPYGSVRNVKLVNDQTAANQPTHEQFNAGYANRGVKVDTKQPAANDSTRNISITGRQSDGQINKQRQRSYQSTYKNILKNKLPTNITTSGTATLRARSVNIFIRSSGIHFWLTFQLLCAILNIVSLSVLLGAEYVDSMIEVQSDDGLLVTGTKYLAQFQKFAGQSMFGLRGLIDSALEYAGIGSLSLEPQGLFIITFVIMFAFGLTTLLGVYLIYKAANLSPLGGEGGGLKIGTFIIALVGYMIPILNLFPWFYIWTMAVQRHPK